MGWLLGMVCCVSCLSLINGRQDSPLESLTPPTLHPTIPQPPQFNPRANVFQTMFDYTRSLLFPNQSVCVPHSVSVGTGIPWVAHPVSQCDTCALLKLNIKSSVNVSPCHNFTIPSLTQCCIPGLTCKQVHLPSFNISDILVPTMFAWCLEQNGASPPMGVIPTTNCQHIYTINDNKLYHSSGPHRHLMTRKYSTPRSSHNSPNDCVNEENGWVLLLELNKFCRIPAPPGTHWLCGTTVWPELPAQFTGICSLVYMYPAMRPAHMPSPSPISLLSMGSKNDNSNCITDFTCKQTFWSRALGALIPNYGVMQALDQVRMLSHYVEQLANDTAMALGNISLALSSHRLMILQNRVALDYILSSQGGTCTIIGPECCSDVVDPKENLKHLIEDMDHLRQQISEMHNQDNTSWLRRFLGPFWKNILEVCEVFLICMIFVLILITMFTFLLKCICSKIQDATTYDYSMSYMS